MNLFRHSLAEWPVALLRAVVSSILMSHGAGRIYYRVVDEFGAFLSSQGVPGGLVLAWAVTVIEVAGGAVLLLGFFRRSLALYFSLEILAGIILVQWKDGWFSIGLGRNGIEFPLLILASLLLIAFRKET